MGETVLFDPAAMEFWHWWVVGGLFLLLELFTLGFFFLWLGASAVVVGLVMLLFSIPWQLQYVLWAALSVAFLWGWRLFKKRYPNYIQTDQPNLNRRGQQYVGRVFTLDMPIENGQGKIKVDDSIWKIECEDDLKKGTKVEVTGVDGTVLQVLAHKDSPQD